jgi:hypothetical protein
MSTATETIPQSRFILGAGVTAGLLLPDGLSCVPTDVEIAGAAAVRAYGQYEQASSELRDARAAMRSAPEIDAATDQKAIAAGKSMSEQRATVAARQALVIAARAVEASTTNARAAQIALAREIARAKSSWLAAQADVINAAAEEAREILKRLGPALQALASERAFSLALAEFPEQGSLTLVDLRRHDPGATSSVIDSIKNVIDPPTSGNRLASGKNATMSKSTLGGKSAGPTTAAW